MASRREFLAACAAAAAWRATMSAQPSPLRDDLAAANRILAIEGVLDGMGHVSVRTGDNAQSFLLARSMAPQLVTAADIMELTLDGEPVNPQGRTSYQERFIHS
jgi:HCOMODA/2-hydroxy-3-carboxy-muconic semialdehyde decarboxylase